MAFSADEVRVLRRALAEVLGPNRRAAAPGVVVAPRSARDVRDYLALADALADAAGEASRMRAFLLAELARYREALPGAVAGYLDRLTAALAAGHLPGPDDLAALRRLRAVPCGTPEHHRRTALLRRCEILAEHDVRQRLEAHMPAPRRLLTLPLPVPPGRREGGGRAWVPAPAPAPFVLPAVLPAAAAAAGAADEPKPGSAPAGKPKPAGPRPPADPQDPGRRTPTPAEIWPPHRRDRKPDEARSA